MEESQLIRDHWYVGCPASRLTTDAPYACQIGDHHLVIFRDGEGIARALLDRCCHRGVRLSLGRVHDGCIACGYHGWQFGGDGVLRRVPSLPEGADVPDARVPSYPAIERDHYVWVWIAGDSPTPTYEPGLQGLCDGVWIQQTAFWNVDVMAAVENQLDVAHTPFSHPGVYPGHQSKAGEMPTLRSVEFECRSTSDSVVIFAPPRDPDEPAPELGDGVGLFELPYRNYVFLEADDTRAIYNWVPLSGGSCRLEFMGFAKSAQPGPAKSGQRDVYFLDDELPLLGQDRVLLESVWSEGSEKSERSVAADASPLMARRLVAHALQGRLVDERPQRRVFSCRC